MATTTRFPSRVPGWGPRPTRTPVPAAETGPRPSALTVDPVRVLIVDDDAGMRRALRSLVSSERGMRVVGEATTGEEALDAVRRLDPDLVLLDVVLPDLDGVEVARRFGPGLGPAVVFVTGNESHAAAAFGVNAVDYVVKPFTLARFRAALERFRRRAGNVVLEPVSEPSARSDTDTQHNAHDADQGRLGSGSAQPAVSESTFAQRLWIRSRGQVQVVDVGDIEWIESDLRYCWIHLTSGEKRKVREPISRVESRLDPARFVRVHRSVIVHLERVAEAISSTQAKAIVLKNGTRLPMSRSGRRRVFSPRAPR